MRSSWICVDASLVIRLVMEPGNMAIQEAWRQLAGSGIPIAAPSLLYYKVTNGLYRYLAPIGQAGQQGPRDRRLALPCRDRLTPVVTGLGKEQIRQREHVRRGAGKHPVEEGGELRRNREDHLRVAVLTGADDLPGSALG